MVKGETRIDTSIDHDSHLLRFAYLHVQLGEEVARKYLQSGGKSCAVSILSNQRARFYPEDYNLEFRSPQPARK